MDVQVPSTSIKHEGFPFLRLPGELRNKIYKMLLKNTCRVPSGAYSPSGDPTKLSICAAILRVSRQVYCEAVPYLYTLNRFHAHPQLLNGLPFLADSSRPVLSRICSSMITRFYIAVRLDNDPCWNGEDLARAFSGVKELEVEAWQSSYGIADTANLLAFANIRAVSKAKVHGCGIQIEFCHWLEAMMQAPVDATCAYILGTIDWEAWDKALALSYHGQSGLPDVGAV